MRKGDLLDYKKQEDVKMRLSYQRFILKCSEEPDYIHKVFRFFTMLKIKHHCYKMEFTQILL